MGHVLVRLAGHGLRLVPHWPYRFARAAGPPLVEVTVGSGQGERRAVLGPGAASVRDVVDVDEGPVTGDWRLEVGPFTLCWPDGLEVQSPQDPADPTPCYLFASEDAMIFPQGPTALERLAAPDALVAPGQRIVGRRLLGEDIDVVELAYEHDGAPWWQAHWAVPVGRQQALIFTGQAPVEECGLVRAAGDRMAVTLC